MFLASMKDRVRGKGLRVAYAEGKEERAIKAAAILRDENLAVPVLIGDLKTLEAEMAKLGIAPEGIDIHDPQIDKKRAQYVEKYFQLRKHKGISMKDAEEKMMLPHYYGAMMVSEDAIDGMVTGLNSETKPFRPAFEIVKLRTGFKRASSMFVLEWPERLLFFADCAVNIAPDAQALSEIAHATIQTVRWLGHEPRVAFLSFSTRDSATSPLVDKMKEATRLTKLQCPDEVIDGELQMDAALLPEVAQRKAPDSPFTECGANVFIFPDLNCGNIAYKISERLGRAIATGPILQGLNKPINDVSRGCSFQDLANVGVLTAALAHMHQEENPKADHKSEVD